MERNKHFHGIGTEKSVFAAMEMPLVEGAAWAVKSIGRDDKQRHVIRAILKRRFSQLLGKVC